MAMWRLKDNSVSLMGVCPQIFAAIQLAAEVRAWLVQGGDLVVTSANDGRHAETSLHYDGKAVDLRTKDLPVISRERFVISLGGRLGTDFDVVLEDAGGPNEHCHVEWQPRRRD